MVISEQKRRGAWYTPASLVRLVVDAVIDEAFVRSSGGRPVRVVDPSCGDGRFLAAARDRIEDLGGSSELVGFDIDAGAVAEAKKLLGAGASVIVADALGDSGAASFDSFDLVVGNPPFLSQMAAGTTRGGSSEHGGGPYADAAVEFLALAAAIVRPDGGRVAYVLPQSILSARDAEPVRRKVNAAATMIWSSWTGHKDFDAQVVTCALAFEFGSPGVDVDDSWAHVVTARIGVPPVPNVMSDSASTLGERAWLNANFRDEYYGMIPAVGDHAHGPPLITSGLIDPGRSLWGERSVRFAKRKYDAPRIDLSQLDTKMSNWATRRLVPKVLVANQTPIIEAVCDPGGEWLPGVPVVSIYPYGAEPARSAWQIAALLTSPAASAWAWHLRAGSGLSPDAIRVGPALLADLPWPSGPLDAAVTALRAGDVRGCASAVHAAHGIEADEHERLMHWWLRVLERIERRQR